MSWPVRIAVLLVGLAVISRLRGSVLYWIVGGLIIVAVLVVDVRAERAKRQPDRDAGAGEPPNGSP